MVFYLFIILDFVAFRNSLSLLVVITDVVYTLAIPKGDNHDWGDKEVRFFGEKWRTVGLALEGIEELIPLEWNKKVMVERYE
ncbi:hypothetical protein [Streptococcus pyogenes]|uniref:hypothetical protein n=1 Tax=Streptococcus pyogenes TaxID=1314 RepID=UPI0010A158C4|nr:hypothetical protein [Streptococcus pyogenes]